MITLDNFESNVPYKILMRGLNYYESDRKLRSRDINRWKKCGVLVLHLSFNEAKI